MHPSCALGALSVSGIQTVDNLPSKARREGYIHPSHNLWRKHMTRNHMNDEEREASRILDLARTGDTPGLTPELIRWALRVLGDMRVIPD